jgi:hypothetical protein
MSGEKAIQRVLVAGSSPMYQDERRLQVDRPLVA